jgi:hypothetical protein
LPLESTAIPVGVTTPVFGPVIMKLGLRLSGVGVGDGVGDGDADAVDVEVGVGFGVGEGDGDAVGEPLGVGLGVGRMNFSTEPPATPWRFVT